MAKKVSKEAESIHEYVCPKCGEKQTSVLQWQTCSVAWEFNLAKGYEGDAEEKDRVDGEHEAWACPGCGEDLPTSMSEQFERACFGI